MALIAIYLFAKEGDTTKSVHLGETNAAESNAGHGSNFDDRKFLQSESVEKTKLTKERVKIFEYAKSGHSDTKEFLVKTRAEGKISENEYHREIAHLLAADYSQPLAIIKRLKPK